jgi:GT2 family glycosyltransferase/glycosyltransferase involved in cell wall biosynthesis
LRATGDLLGRAGQLSEGRNPGASATGENCIDNVPECQSAVSAANLVKHSIQLAALAREIRLQAQNLECAQNRPWPPVQPSRDAAQAAQRLVTFAKTLQPDAGRAALAPSASDHLHAFGAEESFDEDAYLNANPDVAEAVTAGHLESGWQHWLKFGRTELRPGGPPEPVPDRSRFLSELRNRTFGVNLFGFLSTASGLGQAARAFARGIDHTGIPLRVIDVAPWKAGPCEIRTLPAFQPYRVNIIQQNADMMQRFVAAYGAHCLNGSYNIASWFWELPSIRASWFAAYRYADEIWVASEFCRRSVQCLTSLPVVRIPLVVDGLERDAIFDRKHFGLPEETFIFGYVFDISSQFERKNPLALVKAFRDAFGNSRDVTLCLKFFNGEHDDHALAQLKAAVQGARNIVLFDSLFSDQQIVSLHNVIDCFVSPHRSEGFGFNIAEAMYFSKPVIATGYSSNMDFMNDRNSYPIDYKLIPIQSWHGPYPPHSVWAEPSINHLTALLRRVLENREERERKAHEAAHHIRREYSVERCAAAIRQRLEELGLHRDDTSADIFRRHRTDHRALFRGDAPSDANHAIRQMKRRPVISVITPVYNIPGLLLRRCIESVKAQWYPFWELCLCDDGSTRPETQAVLQEYCGTDSRIRVLRLESNTGIANASNRAAEISTGEFLAMLDNDDELTPDALYEIARAIDADPMIDLLYTDEDKLDADNRPCDPYFKPDWSPEHLHSVMYILHLLVIRKDLFYSIGEFRCEYSGAQDYDLALRASVTSRKIAHIPKILYHWRKIANSAAAEVLAKPAALDAGRRALEDHVRLTIPGGWVEPGKLPGLFRVRYPIENQPLVSICIPTHDQVGQMPGRGHVSFVSNLVKSILEKTDYQNFELLLCDDGNLSAQTRRALRGSPHRLISYPGFLGTFNFSDKTNFMFRHARGEHIVLLNDDMEVITPEWLRALLEHSQRRAVGAVGARLIFPNDRIQHVGVVIGVNDGAAHVYHNYPAAFIGYNAFTHLVRNYSAVTGACLATRKSILEEVGGFDVDFAIDYNDIDYCLRAGQRGYRVVYTPYAELYHFENQTARRRAACPHAQQLFVTRWAHVMHHDPYYNPNLTRNALDFAPALPQSAREEVLC